MKSSIKKTILGMVSVCSLFLACAEADSSTSQLLWSGSMLGICYFSAKGVEKHMTKEEREEQV